jgi:hypothetical protein
MESVLLIGLCVLAVAVAMSGRRRSFAVDDAGLAAKAHAEAERHKNEWYGTS